MNRCVVGRAVASALVVIAASSVANSAVADAAPARADGHGLGLNLPTARAAENVDTSSGDALPARLRGTTALPASASLQQYALPPGDQGQVGSCVAWATGYTGYGILMREQGITGSPMAPMFVYSQIARGDDEGTTAAVALPMEVSQGIDTRADYSQGDYDFTTQPTAAERTNAARYTLSGSSDLTARGDLRTNVENAIASGLPVAIGFAVRPNFETLTATRSNYVPDTAQPSIGGHEVTIVGYSSTGVTLENSWGTSWGNNGFFTAPWSFVTGSDVVEVHSMGKLVTA
ncbi:C1 family peptidase [Williamsia sp. SKLECPSW1]